MPHVEGIEVPVYTPKDEREAHKAGRRSSWLRWYANTRSKALAALGGRCDCGETNPSELHIVGLTTEAKEWSQLLFYKRLIDAFRNGDDPTMLGKVVCRKCRFRAMNLEAIGRRESKKGTGQFYWRGGQRVEQMAVRRGIDPWGHGFVYAEYEDEYWD